MGQMVAKAFPVFLSEYWPSWLARVGGSPMGIRKMPLLLS